MKLNKQTGVKLIEPNPMIFKATRTMCRVPRGLRHIFKPNARYAGQLMNLNLPEMKFNG